MRSEAKRALDAIKEAMKARKECTPHERDILDSYMGDWISYVTAKDMLNNDEGERVMRRSPRINLEDS